LFVRDVLNETAVLRLSRVLSLLSKSQEIFTDFSWLDARLESGEVRNLIERYDGSETSPSDSSLQVLGVRITRE
jgi:hypothetical protein